MVHTSLPLNIVFDMIIKTNIKLNLIRQNQSLLTNEELKEPEYHFIRFEGNIGNYTNDI